MLKSKFVIILFFLSVLVENVFSQTILPVPLKFGIELGLSSPQSDFGGTTVEYYEGTKYGLKPGFNIGIFTKVNLVTYNIRGAVNYSIHSNSGNAEVDKENSEVETKMNILSLSVGPEFSFSLPASPISPYVGANLLLSILKGETTFQGVSRVPSGTFDVASATRFGIGISTGTEISFSGLNVDLNIRYNLINLIGKEFVDLSSDERVDSYKNLNDLEDPSYGTNEDKHFINSNRIISTLQFNLGIIF